MCDKIALISCSGLSPLGLVVRAATIELALEHENIVAACITEYSAQPNICSPILDDAKIVSRRARFIPSRFCRSRFVSRFHRRTQIGRAHV